MNKPLLKRKKSGTKGLRGFTLVELLLVIFIIATLGAIAIPYFQGQRKHARANAGVATLKSIQTAQEIYEQDMNTYVPAAADFNQLATALGGRINSDGANLQKTLQVFSSYVGTQTTWQLDVVIEEAQIRASQDAICCVSMPTCTYADELPSC